LPGLWRGDIQREEKIMKKTSVFVTACVLLLVGAVAGMAGGVQSRDTIKIGVIYPLTGQAAAYGEDGRSACEIAQEEINSAGGIDGRQVEVVFEDSAGAPKGGVSAAQKLIEIDHVSAIVGPLFSSVVLAVKPIATENEVPIVAPLSSHPDIFAEQGYVFSLDASAAEVGYVEAKYWSEEKGQSRVATLYEMSDNPLAQAQYFEEAWKDFGGTVLDSESFSQGSSDYRTQLTKFKASKPDFVWLRGAYPDVARIIRQMAELNFEVPLEADSQVMVPEFLEMVGPLVDGRLTVVAFGEVTSSESVKRKKAFEEKFRARFQNDPQIVAYHTYDACQLLFASMEKAAVAAGKPLRDAMAGTSFDGVSGSFKMQDNGMSGRSVTMLRLIDGEFVHTGYVASIE
jgi:branched-chain amino acid transport system substrate-binding protein